MKKVSILACLLLLHSNYTQPNIILSSPLLRIADNAGIFNGAIVDILLTRLDVIALIQGEKEWNGSIMKLSVHENKKLTLTAYFRRPEIIFGATYIAITPDHELASSLITHDQKQSVDAYIASVKDLSLFDRQVNSTLQGVFTGSHAINPVSKELLPIYISDYAVECFDTRHSKTRIGVPAHNSKDFDFARFHKLPIKIVATAPVKTPGQSNEPGHIIAAPLLDKNGTLKEAYLGEYRECILTNSDTLNNVSLKDAARSVIEYLEDNNLGTAHKELLKYHYNDQEYSIKDITKIESAVYKNNAQSPYITEQKNKLKIILVYAQADFLEIVEKFLVNVKNTKSLIVALIEESCSIRKNPDCYLLRWCHFTSDQSEKEVFRRDITTTKELMAFSRDLVNFLSDLAHSCPNALKNISQ